MKYRTIAAVLLAFSALQAAGGHIFSTMDANGNEVTSVLNPDGTPVATSNMVEKMIAAMPEPITPDYSTANTQLVATIEAVSPAPGNYAVVSNRAINAVTTNSLGSVTLSQVEDRNAVNYDALAVGIWMYGNAVITHDGDYYIVGAMSRKTALGWDNDAVAGKIRKLGAEGERCVTIGKYTSTTGTGNAAAGRYSFAGGKYTHAEGNSTYAGGEYTHAEGNSAYAEGKYTHAEGNSTYAEGDSTHAEGESTHAEGSATHAEGSATHAEGSGTHAEGEATHAGGYYTHAEGSYTHTGGSYTHAEGMRSAATNNTAFVWQGADGEPYSDYNPGTYPQYGSHGDGTFNIKPVPAAGETDVASGFYIGERSLKSRIDDAIAAINKVKQDKMPYPTNAIPQSVISGLSAALTSKLDKTGGTITGDVEVVGSFVVTTPEMDDQIEIRDLGGQPGVQISNWGTYLFPGKAGAGRQTFAMISDLEGVQADLTDATNYTDEAIGAAIANTNPAFSNAVLSVGLGIDTNTVAAINALVEAGDELPIGGAATVGGLLLALAAAVAALKRTKADASALRYAMPASVALVAENDAATLVCADRAVTNATIASGFSTLNLTFPAAVSGYVRDFYLRVTVAAGESAPAISVPQGVTIENAGGAVPGIADGEASAAATTLVWFSETAPGVFTAKSETVKAVV